MITRHFTSVDGTHRTWIAMETRQVKGVEWQMTGRISKRGAEYNRYQVMFCAIGTVNVLDVVRVEGYMTKDGLRKLVSEALKRPKLRRFLLVHGCLQRQAAAVIAMFDGVQLWQEAGELLPWGK